MAPPNVLVVDDDEDVCEYISELLGSDGFYVKSVTDPQRAVEEFKRISYDLAVVDIMMPRLGGIGLIEKIRRIDNDVAVIVVTGYPSLETATASISHRVEAYLKKPFSTEEFRDTVRRIAQSKGLAVGCEEELHQCIGRTIREIRRSRSLTLKQLGRRARLSVSLLSQIERAESSASVSSLFKIATALDVKLTALFGKF